MAREFNRNLYCPDGYVFMEADGVKHTAGSWRELEAKMREYRMVNGKPVGDPPVEINEQVCAKMPSFCGEVSSTVVIQNADSLTMNQRVLLRLSELLNLKRENAVPKVPDDVAAARAAICLSCPNQRPLVTSCAACINSVGTSRAILLDGSPSLHQNLLPCSALAEDCQTTVHLNLEPSAQKDLPAPCWRRA